MCKVKEAFCYGEIQYGEFDVTEGRNEFIGGSDIPVILGISSFKKRFSLMLEKAGLAETGFGGNRYTQYGHDMEPVIRDYVNGSNGANFQPARIINGDIRYHADGYDADYLGGCVLEVKTTSDIHSSLDGYKHYLCQLVKGMEQMKATHGVLAVYDRPEDMSLKLDPDRLQIFQVVMEDHAGYLNQINRELDRFRADLEKLKENPLLTEEDFLPVGSSLTVLANKVESFERQLAAIKETEARLREAKQQLCSEMQKHGVTGFSTPNGTKITLVAASAGTTKTVKELDDKALKADHPEIYSRYLREVLKTTSGKAAYVRITLPK